MSCKIYDEDVLRPCGKRCKDFKTLLLKIANSDEQVLFAEILQNLYFGKFGEPGQKKGVLITNNDDLPDADSPIQPTPIILYALLEGPDNRTFTELVKNSKNFRPGLRYNCSTFGRVRFFMRSYNKCFCDICLFSNLTRQWFQPKHCYRVLVYKDFYIVKYQYFVRYKTGISLTQQAMEVASPYFKCCEINYKYPFSAYTLWFGNEVNPISSTCIFAPRRKSNTLVTTKRWSSLQTSYWWLRNIRRNYLEVYSEEGYIFRITDYPKKIKSEVNMDSDDLFSIFKVDNRRFIIARYYPPYYYNETKLIISQ